MVLGSTEVVLALYLEQGMVGSGMGWGGGENLDLILPSRSTS